MKIFIANPQPPVFASPTTQWRDEAIYEPGDCGACPEPVDCFVGASRLLAMTGEGSRLRRDSSQ